MLLFLGLAAAQVAPFDIKADYGDLSRQRCAKEWPTDFVLQETCVTLDREGMAKFKMVRDQIGPPIDPALETCTSDFTEDRLPNWMLIGACAEMQAESYRRLRRAGQK